MPLFIFPIVWIAVAAGRRVNALVLKCRPPGIAPLERSLFGLATGFGLLAYGVLAIGLLRLLTPVPVIAWFVILAVLGWREHVTLARDLATGLKAIRFSPIGWLIVLIFAGCAAVALIGCFTPPTMLEWDSMSYHLADPKIYLQNHRILYLPWESHSNFAFTMEMLYTVGLMAHSIPLAKLFHFTLGVAGTLATYLIGARAVSRPAGIIAALIFASLPIVMWEAGTAYVDLAATAFGALGLLALVNWATASTPNPPAPAQNLTPRPPSRPRKGEPTMKGSFQEPNSPIKTPAPPVASRAERASESSGGGAPEEPGWVSGRGGSWLWMSAIMMGWMVSVKATSLIPLFLFAVFVLVHIWRSEGQTAIAGLKVAVLYGLLAVTIGSVWYIKSFLYTDNPFYPFAYHVVGNLFGGRYWNEPNAISYAASQKDFGVGHRLTDLVSAPWNLTMYLLPGHGLPTGAKGFNDFQNDFTALSPLFLATLFAPALLKLQKQSLVVWLAWYALASVLIWFFLTQQVRYLLPVVPALCVLAAFVVCELWSKKAIAGYALAGLLAVSVAFSLFVALDYDPTWVPAQAQVAFGRIPADTYITRYFPAYQALQFLNTDTPADAKVVLYGEPLGFYCDREYLWGEPGHSLLIPYDSLLTPEDLRAYFKRRGYRYILVNQVFAPLKPGSDWAGKVYAITLGSGAAPVFSQGPISIYAI